jgi:hypothetical protein
MNYIKDFKTKIITKNTTTLWLLGRKLANVNLSTFSNDIIGFNSIKDLVKKL